MRKFTLLILTVFLAVGVWYFAFVNSRCLAKPETVETIGTDLKIGTVNIKGFRHLGDCRKSATMLLESAVKQDLDIIVIQEFFLSKKMSWNDFAGIFSADYPYLSLKGECAIASRLPIVEHRKVKFQEKTDYFSSVLIDGGAECGQFRVLAVHLRTTGMYNYRNGADVSNSDELKAMVGLMEGNGKIRLAQSLVLKDIIDSKDEPLIVTGDFNALPLSKVYNNIKGNRLSDSFIERGSGKGSTYRRLKDLFRIDYIFHDDSFQCIACATCDEEFSDHRMVTATLRKK